MQMIRCKCILDLGRQTFFLLLASIACPGFSVAQFPYPSGIECLPSPYGCPGDSSPDGDNGYTPPVYQRPRTYPRRSFYPPRVSPRQRADQRASELNQDGKRLYEGEDFAGAIAKLRQALALAPSDKVLRNNLAMSERALRLKQANVLNNAAIALSKRRNFDAAIVELHKALRLAPWNKTIRNNLAITQNNIKNALARQKIKEGDFLRERGNLQGALSKYNEAHRIDKSNDNARAAIAATKILIVQRSFATVGIRNILKTGKALLADGDLTGAKEEYLAAVALGKAGQSREVISFGKNLAQAEVELAAVLRRLDDLGGAIERYRQAMTFDPALKVFLSSEVAKVEAEANQQRQQAEPANPILRFSETPRWTKNMEDTKHRAVVELNAAMMTKAHEVYQQTSAGKQTVGRWIIDSVAEQAKDIGAKIVMNRLGISETYQSEIRGRVALMKKFEAMSESYKSDILSKIVVWYNVTVEAISCLGSTQRDCRGVELEQQHLSSSYVETGHNIFKNWVQDEQIGAFQKATLDATEIQQEKDNAIRSAGSSLDRFLARIIRREP